MAEFTEVIKAMCENCDKVSDCDKCEINRMCNGCIFFGNTETAAAQEHVALAIRALSVPRVPETQEETE